MSILPTGNRGSSLAGGLYQRSVSNTRDDRSVSDTNVGLGGETLRIQEWLSPLEPHARHQDVRSRRLDGVGNWVLRRNDFESWRMGQDGSGSPTLLCYGDQGVGKTYIRYMDIFKRPGNANKKLNQFISNRQLIGASLWAEYGGFVPLLRLPGTGGPIGGEYGRESTQAGFPRSGGDCRRNSECL